MFGTDKRLPKDNQINAKNQQKIYERGCEQVMKPKKTKKPKKVKGKRNSKKTVNGYYIADGKIRTLYDDHWSTK